MPDSEQLTVIVTATQKDYATALRELSKHRSGWTSRVLLWISCAYLAWMVYTLLRKSEMPLLSMVLLAACLALVLLFFWLLKHLVHWFAARQFVKKNPTKLGPSKVAISSEGVSYEGAHARGEAKWSAYSRILETKDLFLLYPQSNQAQILPKRCFETPDEAERIRGILKAHYKGKLELLS